MQVSAGTRARAAHATDGLPCEDDVTDLQRHRPCLHVTVRTRHGLAVDHVLNRNVDSESRPPGIIRLHDDTRCDRTHRCAIARVEIDTFVLGRAPRTRRCSRSEAVADRARRIHRPLERRRNSDSVGIPGHGRGRSEIPHDQTLRGERPYRRSRRRGRVGRHPEAQRDHHGKGCRSRGGSRAHRLHGTQVTQITHGAAVQGGQFWTVFGRNGR